MQKQPGSTHESKRRQDIRARAIDATFDADRRRVGERVAVVFRWLFLVVLGVLNNVNPHTDQEAKVTIYPVVRATTRKRNILPIVALGSTEKLAGVKRDRDDETPPVADRWDAGGKAEGLTGESIPLMARILSVAERFEAQTAGRGCPRVTQEEALAQVVLGSGSEFDPEVVDALGRAVSEKGLELDFPAVALPAMATA